MCVCVVENNRENLDGRRGYYVFIMNTVVADDTWHKNILHIPNKLKGFYLLTRSFLPLTLTHRRIIKKGRNLIIPKETVRWI